MTLYEYLCHARPDRSESHAHPQHYRNLGKLCIFIFSKPTRCI